MAAPKQLLTGRLAVLPLIVLALGERPGRAGWRPPQAGAPVVLVYVTYNAFHSDLVVPESALRTYGMEGPTMAAAQRLRPAPWIALGWGDMRFYRGQGLGLQRAADALRAAVWPGNIATVLVRRSSAPQPERGDWKAIELRLSPSDFQAMVRRMNGAFVLHNGRPVADADAIDPQEIYFNGRGDFSIVNDCNQWIGDAMAAAGAPHNRVLDTTSWGLSLDMRLRAGATKLAAGALRAPDRKR